MYYLQFVSCYTVALTMSNIKYPGYEVSYALQLAEIIRGIVAP